MVASRRLALTSAALLAGAGTAFGVFQTHPDGLRLFAAFFGTGVDGKVTAIGWSLEQSLSAYGGARQEGGGFTFDGGLFQASRPAQLDLSRAHAFPVPFRADLGHTLITFTRLTVASVVRIYSVSGRLVRTLRKTDTGNDKLDWDVRNEAGERAASGLYLYVIDDGREIRKGKLVVIR